MEQGIRAVGHVTGSRSDRRDDGWGAETATIVLTDEFDDESVLGLDGFSHVEVVFRFHGIGDDDVTAGARHPRNNPSWPRVGIFAQRASKRPNRLGVTVCELLGVEGRRISVRGLDAIDGTPVLDVKPVMRAFLPRGEVAEPGWVEELMAGYWHPPAAGDDT